MSDTNLTGAALTDDKKDHTANVSLKQTDTTKWENPSNDIAGVKLGSITAAGPVAITYHASTGKVTIDGKEAKSNAGVS